MLTCLYASCVLFAAVDGPPQAPTQTSSVSGGITRSAAPEPGDRHAQTISLTVVCQTPAGEPIAGASVTCFEIDSWTAQARAKTTLHTDATGTCRFQRVVVPLGDVSRVVRGTSDVFCDVAAKADGRATSVRTLNERGFPALQHVKGSEGWMKLIMEPAQTLRGRVTNFKGDPLEGALVYMAPQPQSALPFAGYCNAKTDKRGWYQITDLKEWVRPKDAGQIRITSQRGNAVIGEQVPDHFFVNVWHPDYGERWAQGDELPGELNVQLPEVGGVTGRAIDATTKRPLAGVLVQAEARPTRGGDFRASYCVNWAITDAKGQYRLGLRAENEYLVFARAEGFISLRSPRIRALPANATVTAEDLTLVQAGTVRAHLLDAASKQRLRFSSKPQVSVVLRTRREGAQQDQVFPAEFTQGSAFLMRAAIPDRVYSIAVESEDPAISPRKDLIVFNVRPGETIEIDLRVDVRKPARGE
jgi:hypothetical protein